MSRSRCRGWSDESCRFAQNTGRSIRTMTARLAIATVILGGGGSAAFAEKPEPPVRFEVGLNTRHFTAVEGDAIAFRSEAPNAPGSDAQTAVSVGLRFTRWLPHNLFG